jgi:hypothetical protein
MCLPSDPWDEGEYGSTGSACAELVPQQQGQELLSMADACHDGQQHYHSLCIVCNLSRASPPTAGAGAVELG